MPAVAASPRTLLNGTTTATSLNSVQSASQPTVGERKVPRCRLSRPCPGLLTISTTILSQTPLPPRRPPPNASTWTRSAQQQRGPGFCPRGCFFKLIFFLVKLLLLCPPFSPNRPPVREDLFTITSSRPTPPTPSGPFTPAKSLMLRFSSKTADLFAFLRLPSPSLGTVCALPPPISRGHCSCCFSLCFTVFAGHYRLSKRAGNGILRLSCATSSFFGWALLFSPSLLITSPKHKHKHKTESHCRV